MGLWGGIIVKPKDEAHRIALDIMGMFREAGEERREFSDHFSTSDQYEIQLLFGSITDLRVILYKNTVTIHPGLLEEQHKPVWDQVKSKYLERIVVPEQTKGVFLD